MENFTPILSWIGNLCVALQEGKSRNYSQLNHSDTIIQCSNPEVNSRAADILVSQTLNTVGLFKLLWHSLLLAFISLRTLSCILRAMWKINDEFSQKSVFDLIESKNWLQSSIVNGSGWLFSFFWPLNDFLKFNEHQHKHELLAGFRQVFHKTSLVFI